jgi:hypothetical protein
LQTRHRLPIVPTRRAQGGSATLHHSIDFAVAVRKLKKKKKKAETTTSAATADWSAQDVPFLL